MICVSLRGGGLNLSIAPQRKKQRPRLAPRPSRISRRDDALVPMASAAEGSEVMTPKEIHDMNLRMAVEVMGWPEIKGADFVGFDYPAAEISDRQSFPATLTYIDSCFIMKDAGQIEHGGAKCWSPCTDIKQAMECREAMRQQANITIYGWEDRDVVTAFLRNIKGAPIEVHCQFPDLCLTIVKVICQVLDAGKNQKG